MAKKVLSEIDVATTQILTNDSTDGSFYRLIEPGTGNIVSCDTGGFVAADSYNCAGGLAKLYKKYLTTLRKNSKIYPALCDEMSCAFVLKDGASINIVQ